MTRADVEPSDEQFDERSCLKTTDQPVGSVVDENDESVLAARV